MSIQEALFWGVGGTAIVQVFLFLRALERCKQLPWKSTGESPAWIWLLTALLYAVIAAFVVFLLHSMGQIETPWAGFITGVGADRVIENALKQYGSKQNKLKRKPRNA